MARAAADTASAAIELADSARAMWTEAIGLAGGGQFGARCTYRLALSLEDAMFAGARDSAATLYEKLAASQPQGRWSSLAGLRLGVIHLDQERHFLAYRTISLWGEQNAYAVNDVRYRTALAEASFLTGRYNRAVSLMDELNPGELDTPTRRRFDAFRVRSLVAMGEYGRAVGRLVVFRDNYREPESERIAAALATELYYAAGSPELAARYGERLKDILSYEELAKLFSLQARLAHGGDQKVMDRLRKDFEDLRDAPWNPYLKIDIAFQAHRGIISCYAATGELDKMSEARDGFRRKYPERRAALAVLMLDEIDANLKGGHLQKAVSLNDDLNLLFADVCPEDRLLWVGWKLAVARADVAEANRRLNVLAAKYPWSDFGKLARLELIGLNLAANRPDDAARLLESVEEGAELRTDQRLGAQARIAGARGDWQRALELRRRQWASSFQAEGRGRAVLGWADAAGRAGRISEALEVLSAFWAGDNAINAEARLALAEQYKAAGQPARALSALEGAISSVPPGSEQSLQAMYRQGMLLEELGQPRQAVEAYKRLEQMAGQNSDWLRSARNRLRELETRTGTDSTSQAGNP
jgi:tetratricopeptide (TPR) repeat protein